MSDDIQPSDPFSPSPRPPRRRGPFFGADAQGRTRWDRRKERIKAEIERNRAGDYKVPTWVLFLILVVVVVGFALFVALA